MSLLASLGGLPPAALLIAGGVLLALVAWLSWRKPTWLLLLALAALALRPQLLWGGPEVGWQWGLQQTLLVFALAVNALHYGLRRTIPWPVLALLATFALSLAFGHLYPKLTLPLMLEGLAILALPWIFPQVVLEPGSRQKYAMTLALVPLLSVAISAILHLLDIRPVIDVEETGALRLQGAAGIPADLALLAFAGFALALHESTRTTRRYFTYLGYLNFVLVVLSGTRMAIAASVLLFVTYSLLFPPMRARWRQNAVAAALGLGVIALAGGLYLPNLELRMFDEDGVVSLSGRDAMWSFYFDQFLLSPIFGRGLGSGFIAFAEHTSFGLPTPHNAYLHLLVIGGVVGLALFLGALGLWSRDILRRVRGDDRAFLYALLPAIGLYALTENLLILPSALPIFVYLGITLTRSMRDLQPGAATEPGSAALAPRWPAAPNDGGPFRHREAGQQPSALASGGLIGREP